VAGQPLAAAVTALAIAAVDEVAGGEYVSGDALA
jgi:hypothetical protein